MDKDNLLRLMLVCLENNKDEATSIKMIEALVRQGGVTAAYLNDGQIITEDPHDCLASMARYNKLSPQLVAAVAAVLPPRPGFGCIIN